ncbi:LOW QUALITY PROTEIN: protein SHORTAGE IN CHIASMATA 1-like [Durio zibethinus]|uniref:LOW QUALITY PROTEIN: protein SHORTAGE IN CHIASMATA 1-like n=1 Tax=Durio zibethinus TaxID=66656 RepID=A0A6P5X9W8_DURZI|nr:LOW QUALITY PROTEIN: protein SHORTAGE IN CHIASMATA 1-like [Durio zibethinus]
MRTRFMNTDYVTTSQSPTETINFLHLPPPRLPPWHLSIFNDVLLHFDPFLNVPLQTERLPIDAALSKFLSEAIPQFIDVDFRDFEDTRSSRGNVGAMFSEKEAMVCNEKEAGSQITFGSEVLEKDNATRADDKDVQRFEVILFETPALDTFLDNTYFSEKEIETFCTIPEVDNNQDEIEPIVQYSKMIQESVYSVEDVTSDDNMEQNNYMLEEDSSFGDQVLLQHSTFPILEVDEISLGIMTSQSMDYVLPSVFESIESQLWTQENNVLIDSKELLGSIGYDILLFLSDHCLSKQFPEPELSFPEMFLDVNLICMVETPQVDWNSEFYMAKHDADYFLPMNLVLFEEFQNFDVDSSQNFEVFLNRQVTYEPEACNQMFREDMNLKSFNELVVSHELVLVDETFKSLPVPVLSDYRRKNLTCTGVEELLSELKPLLLSSSDDIYLDWYILEEDKCNNKVCSFFQNMVEEIDSYNIDFDRETLEDGKLVSNFIFLDDDLSGSATEHYEEALNVSSDSIPMLNGHLMAVVSGDLQDNGCPKPGNSEQLAEKDAKRASLLFKSMSQFNDLDFFLNPQKRNTGENAGPAALSFNPNVTLPNVSSVHSVEARASADVQLQQWDITVYTIKLTDDIVALIDNFEKSFLAILQNETELITFLPADNFELLSLPKHKLMECIKKKMARRTISHKDEDIMAFVTLCAIKQMAWYMCFYGIQATHLYVDKLWRSLGCMKSRLSFLHSLIEDACGKVGKEITRSHPSLCVIQGILQSNTGPSSSKVLILTEQVFWWSLKSLLMSMGLTWNELSSVCTSANPSDADKMVSQLNSGCWLVSQEHVSSSFPFNKFNLIVEYGGLCGSSRVSSFSPKSVGLTHLHFLKIELDGSSASKALCEGVDMPQATKKLMEGEFDSILALDDNLNYERLEDLLNFIPIEDKYNKRSVESVDKVEVQCRPLPVAVEPKLTQQRMVDIVIVVNTQNFDKEMIVSRRSTYQKILAKEKEGAQVVERDSNLPVDVIISSAICLVWYDCRNIGQKAATLDEATSCLPSCIEYIATNLLTLLSFTFSGCFLVFEGEIGFLSTVMESSAGLYAAAASLGIDFQLFCSYSYELTDEIIINCIDYAAKKTRGLYPKMPDSETLAESFLTKFPSINPLTAHAILSSGGMLIEFLEWSHERRIYAVQNYCVPDESVFLFSVLCKYGEREDSKSVMTDCSSVSSGPDSDKCHHIVGSKGKQRQSITSPHKISIRMDEFMHFEPLNQCTDDFLNPSGLSKPHDSWISKGSEMFQDYKKHRSSLKAIFDQKQEFDFPTLLSSQIPKQYDSHISEGPKMLNEAKKPKLSIPLKDNMWDYNQGENMAMLNTLDWQNINNFENQHKDLVCEVIDLTDSPMSGEGFSSFGNSTLPFSLVPEIEKDSIRKSKIARRLSCGKGSDTVFPYVSEINTGPDILSFVKYPRQSFQGTNDNPDTCYKDKLPASDQENLIWDVLAQGSAACKGSLLKNYVSNHRATPLSKAILSAHPQSGSPWTIEFLNRIKEKSRLHKQNPPDASASPFEISGNIAKVPKRRSPSILEFFKYQGGSTPRKLLEQRRKKRCPQSSILSKNEKTSSYHMQTCTPMDKRARQTLSFAMNDSGSQTKLVWSDGSAHGLSKKLRNQ